MEDQLIVQPDLELEVDDDLEVKSEELDSETTAPVLEAQDSVEEKTEPVLSEAEVEAKEGSMPDLSEPKPKVVPSLPMMSQEQARERYEVLNSTYKQVRASRDEFETEMTRLNKEMQVLKPFVTEKVDPQENQHGIIRYIANQNALRKAKAERTAVVLQGLKLHDILPKKGSSLDQAMARKTARGTHRPNHPNSIVNQ